MTKYLKAIMLMAFVAALAVAGRARADFQDYNYKAWAQHGRTSSRSMVRSRVYRAPATMIVQTEEAPDAVAQSPTTERRFSYEPSQQVDLGAFETTQPSVRSYSRPMTRGSKTPAYLLPKTDPRKYSGRL